MKARLTITLDEELLAQVDRAVEQAAGEVSRSAVIEEAVRRWSRTRYEALVRDYYRRQPEEERDEDARWAELSARDLANVARDAPRPRARAPRARRRRRG